MPLEDVEFSLSLCVVPDEIVAFLDEADARIDDFRSQHHVPNFVTSDYVAVYKALRRIADDWLAPGNVFCEWGSGFGVVSSLAAMLDFAAYGIEVDANLVASARTLAEDFELEVDFVSGSFIPPEMDDVIDRAYRKSDPDSWRLITESDYAYEVLGLAPNEVDLVFVYPWPGEEIVIQRLFEKSAAAGSLLLTYGQQGDDSMRLQRALAKKRRSRK